MPAVPIPPPDENAAAWDTLSFKQGKTEFVWPEDEEYGVVEWSAFEPSAKIDKKAKSGAAKPRVTQVGGDAVEFTITLHIAYHVDGALRTVEPILDKLRPGAGPFQFSYPWAAFISVRGFLVEKVKYNPPAGGELTVEIACVEVNLDAQSGKGGNVTKTPGREGVSRQTQADFEAYAQAIAQQRYMEAQAHQQAQDLVDAAAKNGDVVAARVPRKLRSITVGESEVGTYPVQPTKPSAERTDVATGSVNG